MDKVMEQLKEELGDAYLSTTPEELVLRAQMIKMQNMYDELLTKYRDEISNRTALELAYTNLINQLKAQGVKFGDEEHTCGEGCNCKNDNK